jgi:hypothetical protein
LPSDGGLIVASTSVSTRLTTSGGGGLSEEQACWPRSCWMRSIFAMPWSRNEAFIIACACASSSALPGTLAQPATRTATAANVVLLHFITRAYRLIEGAIDCAPLALMPI